MKKLTTLVAVAACLPVTATAQTERDLDSHEHGVALLNVALDGDELFIELESPWDNLVGFEHAPETEEQHELIDAATELLENPVELFALDAGNCSLTSSMIESGIELGHDDEHHDDHDDEHKDEHDDHDDDHKDEHDDHDDDHKDEHDDHDDEHEDEHADHDDDHKDEHDDHDDEHADHDDHDDETHSELVASYVFTCSSMSDLKTIDVKFLNQWTGFETLSAQLIGPSGQGLQELNSSNITIDLSEVQ